MAMLNNQSVHHCILSLYMVMKCREGKAIFAKPEGIAGILEVEEIKPVEMCWIYFPPKN